MLNFFRKKSDAKLSWVRHDSPDAFCVRRGFRLLDRRASRADGPTEAAASDTQAASTVFVSIPGQTSYSVPIARSERLPKLSDVECGYRFSSSVTYADKARERAQWCARTVRRIAPWATLVAGPGLVIENSPGSEAVTWCSGMAYSRLLSERDIVCVSLDGQRDMIQHAAYHELWHLVEPWLSNEAAAVASAPQGSDWESDLYLSSGEEVRANRFAHWAMCIDHGVPMPGREPGRRDLHALFWLVYSGELGTQIAAARAEKAAVARSAHRD